MPLLFQNKNDTIKFIIFQNGKKVFRYFISIKFEAISKGINRTTTYRLTTIRYSLLLHEHCLL